jgi:hypothetical protein
MNRRIIALAAGAFTALLPFLLPATATADTFVTLGNLEPKTLKFSVRCAGTTTWHDFSLAAGKYDNFGAGNWNGNECDTYELSIGTNQSNGSTRTQVIRMTNEHTYLLVKTESVGYAAHDAKQMIVVVNASSRDVDLSYFCAGVKSKVLSVDKHSQTWLYVGSPSACNPYVGSVRETSGTTLPTTPLPTAMVYTLNWNNDRHLWNVNSAPVGKGVAAPGN